MRRTPCWTLVAMLAAAGCDGVLVGPDDASPLDGAPRDDGGSFDVGPRDAPSSDTASDVPLRDGESLPGLSCMGPPPPPPIERPCERAAPAGCTPREHLPLGHWRFEPADRARDERGAHPLRFPSGADGVASFGADGAVGEHLAMRTASPDNNVAVYIPYAEPLPARLTLELFVRFRPRTLRYEDIRVVRLLGIADLRVSREGWSLGGATFPLDGDDVAGWPYYTDGAWHHLALVADGTTVSLTVDGRHPSGWSVPATLGSGTGPGIYFGYHEESASQGLDMDLDEVALYDSALPTSVLAQHALEGLAGGPYAADTCGTDWCDPGSTDPALDPQDYVPGWSATDWRAASLDPLTQFQRFPLPRFRQGHALPRVPGLWVNLDYLAGQFEQVPGTFAQRFDNAELASNATALQLELIERWHHTLVRHDRIDAAWTSYANAHPEVPLASGSFWRGAVSSLSGSQLVAGAASPALDPAIFAPDGVATRDGFVSWASAQGLTRGFDIITENGETPVDHVYSLTEAQLATNATANAHWTANRAAFGGEVRAYASSRQTAFIRAYRDAFLAPRAADRPAALRDALFLYYGLDGHPTYAPTWSIARDALGLHDDGHPRAATSFYPRQAAWWYTGSSAWHGWRWILESRAAEIASGDAHFWPLVASGWAFHEERNMRPAQWLAILKSLSVAGADTTLPAFFVIPGCGGGFGGATDCDCGGDSACLANVVQNRAAYAWQTVAPSYAQGVASRYDALLLDPASEWLQSVVSSDPGSLVVVRRLGQRFVIAVSTHTLTNQRTARSYSERVVPIALELDGAGATTETLRLPARAQGSVYLLDTSSTPPTLVQLDAWHESTHPSHWSADFALEAEVDDGRLTSGGTSWVTRTEAPLARDAWDFGDFTTYLAVSPADGRELAPGAAPRASFVISPRSAQSYGVWVRARTRGRAGVVRVALDDGSAETVGCVRSGEWSWVRLSCPTGSAASLGTVTAGAHTVHVEPSNADLEIDALRLTVDDACFADALDCVGCSG